MQDVEHDNETGEDGREEVDDGVEMLTMKLDAMKRRLNIVMMTTTNETMNGMTITEEPNEITSVTMRA